MSRASGLLGRARAAGRRFPVVRRDPGARSGGGSRRHERLSSAAAPRPSKTCRDALADGARQALPVGLACAVVGIVIGTMTLTGIGTIFGNWVVSIGRDSLFLSLILTMIVSLILGMGIPTIPNYIITSSLAAPVLLTLDVPLIVSHMFVFYFGIMADLTPPVALAAFAAAPIAKESGFKIGFQALRIALPGFVIPFMAVYDPTLMMQPVPGLDGAAFWVSVAYMVFKAGLAMLLWGVASVGYLSGPPCWWERIGAAAAAACLVLALPDHRRDRLRARDSDHWPARLATSPEGRDRGATVICLLAGSVVPLLARRDHARLVPFGGKDPLGGGLAGRPRRSRTGGGAHRGLGSRAWTRRIGPPHRRHLELEARSAAARRRRHAPLGRDRRLAGLRRGRMPSHGRLCAARCRSGGDGNLQEADLSALSDRLDLVAETPDDGHDVGREGAEQAHQHEADRVAELEQPGNRPSACNRDAEHFGGDQNHDARDGDEIAPVDALRLGQGGVLRSQMTR